MATQNNNIDNVSDVMPSAGTNANVSPQQLPIRGEKRIIPSPVSSSEVSAEFTDAYVNSGNGTKLPKFSPGRTSLVQDSDFNVVAAMSPFVDYVVIRLNNRGLDGNGQPTGSPAVYRFLINPSQVVVNRTTLDGQAFARSGWQIGVWGEDSLQISITGKTAGQYFAFGTTDRYQPFTESYRNLEQLQVVFENNGYWFEGEQAAEGPLAANGVGYSGGPDFTRRIIKMHADVELIVGNFMWYGMFESLTISQDAESPFLMSFQMQFIAWKERFRQGSPYADTIHNDIKRGHDYGSWKTTALAVQQAGTGYGTSTSVDLTPPSINSTLAPADLSALGGGLSQPPPPPSAVPPAQPAPAAPATLAANDSNTYSQIDPTGNDTTFSTPVLAYSTSTVTGFWKGMLSPLTFGKGGKNT